MRTHKFTYYEGLDGDKIVGIKCLKCKKTSWNSNDVTMLYCSFCHLFHELPSNSMEQI